MKSGFFASILCLGLFLSCKNPQSPDIQLPPPPAPPYSWSTSTPGAQGIDSASLAQAVQEFRSVQYVESFLLVRNGFLVKEAYYTSPELYTNASIASVTKSITSALVGISLREHYLDSVGQTMLGSFPEYVTPGLDPRKAGISLEDLLTMRSGFAYTETDDHSNIFNEGTDWMREAINLPMASNPGEVFNYASVNAHLVSGMLTKGAHMSTSDLARQFLLQPLHITVVSWPSDPQGYYFGGSGVVMYPRDMARFGYLYVLGGSLNDTSIIPTDWVRSSTQPRIDLSTSWGAFTSVKYGYFWWSAQWNANSVFLAVGFGGQFIIGVPLFNLVIVVTSNLDCTQAEADQRHLAILDILARDVLRAVRN